MIRKTALKVIQQSCLELGLPDVSSIEGTTNATVKQMLGLLNALGQELVLLRSWQHLHTTSTFTGDGSTTMFAMPSDFGRVVDQTAWDTTNHWPLDGPRTNGDWVWLTKGIITSGPRIRYRFRDDQIECFPTPSNGQEFYFEYIKANWVHRPGAPVTYHDEASQDDDIAMFEFRLLVAGLKFKFWEVKGFDTTNFLRDYKEALEGATSSNAPAPVLNMAPQPTEILLGINNLPDTGYG